MKIVNGKEAVPHSWPSIVYIEKSYNYDYKFPGETMKKHTYTEICGGTLIDRYTVLSAAHCFTLKIEENGITIPVKVNKYHKTLESVFNLYVGMHDTAPIVDGGKIAGKKLTTYKVINVIILLINVFF